MKYLSTIIVTLTLPAFSQESSIQISESKSTSLVIKSAENSGVEIGSESFAGTAIEATIGLEKISDTEGEIDLPKEPKTNSTPIENPKPAPITFQNILFDTGKATLRPASLYEINLIAELLLRHPKMTAIIEGHTDAIGSTASNQSLSEQRAEAVIDKLVSKHGIDRARLKARGKGELEPIASNETEEGRQLNRRVIVYPSAY